MILAPSRVPQTNEAERPDRARIDATEQYRQLLELTTKEASGEDAREGRVYQRLMKKERRVLDTIDRVVNDAAARKQDDEHGNDLLKMTLHEIVMRTAGSMRALWDDLIEVRSLADLQAALLDPIRMPFIGIALITISGLAAMLQLFDPSTD